MSSQHYINIHTYTQVQDDNTSPFTNIVVDEVEVVPWSDGHGPGSPLGEGDVGLVQGLVDVDEPIDDGLAVGRGLGKVRVHNWKVVWNDILQKYTLHIKFVSGQHDMYNTLCLNITCSIDCQCQSNHNSHIMI